MKVLLSMLFVVTAWLPRFGALPCEARCVCSDIGSGDIEVYLTANDIPNKPLRATLTLDQLETLVLEAVKHPLENVFAAAEKAGALASTLAVVDLEELPLTYMPGNCRRVRVRVAGELA